LGHGIELVERDVSAGNTLSLSTGHTLSIFGPLLINAGTLAIDGSTGANPVLSLGSDVTLSGGGTVTITGGNGGTAYLCGGGVTLINADNTIEGNGYVGDNATLAVVNQATIDANTSGATIDLNAGAGGVTNRGTLEAANGATLALHNTITNTGGNIQRSAIAAPNGRSPATTENPIQRAAMRFMRKFMARASPRFGARIQRRQGGTIPVSARRRGRRLRLRRRTPSGTPPRRR